MLQHRRLLAVARLSMAVVALMHREATGHIAWQRHRRRHGAVASDHRAALLFAEVAIEHRHRAALLFTEVAIEHGHGAALLLAEVACQHRHRLALVLLMVAMVAEGAVVAEGATVTVLAMPMGAMLAVPMAAMLVVPMAEGAVVALEVHEWWHVVPLKVAHTKHVPIPVSQGHVAVGMAREIARGTGLVACPHLSQLLALRLHDRQAFRGPAHLALQPRLLEVGALVQAVAALVTALIHAGLHILHLLAKAIQLLPRLGALVVAGHIGAAVLVALAGSMELPHPLMMAMPVLMLRLLVMVLRHLEEVMLGLLLGALLQAKESQQAL